MKIWACDQNSEQWEQLRRGIPTASEFHKIICPSMGKIYRCGDCGVEYSRSRKKCECGGSELTPISVVKPSAQADDYIYRLIAESMSNQTFSPQPTIWMERGHQKEADAVAEYEFQTGNDTVRVGFCTTDDGLIGASPDRFVVGSEGLLEVKAPSPWVHVRHLVIGDLEDDHKVQVQGQMLVTGRKWADVISYCDGYPNVIIRVDRDDNYIGGMNELLAAFVERLHRTRAELIQKYGDFRPQAICA